MSHSQQRDVIIIKYKFWIYGLENWIVLFLYQGSFVSYCFSCFTSIEHNLYPHGDGWIITIVHCCEWSLEKGGKFQWNRKTKQRDKWTCSIQFSTGLLCTFNILIFSTLGISLTLILTQKHIGWLKCYCAWWVNNLTKWMLNLLILKMSIDDTPPSQFNVLDLESPSGGLIWCEFWANK